MLIEQVLGRAEEHARLADDSGQWATWTQACRQLREAASASALVDIVHDRTRPARANELLLALVRVGSADSGVDQAATTLVASLLAPGANRIIRSLSTLGPDVGDIVAGHLWLHVRDYRWRDKPRAVAKNVLMDTRRAVLTDYGASTYRRAAPILLPSPEDVSRGDHALEQVTFDEQVPDLALLQLLAWATAGKVLRHQDAALLWNLTSVDVDLQAVSTKPLSHGGAGSKRALTAYSEDRGLSPRTVRRHRDLAVAALREARNAFRGDFDAGPMPHLALADSLRPLPGPSRPAASGHRRQGLRSAQRGPATSTRPSALSHSADVTGR